MSVRLTASASGAVLLAALALAGATPVGAQTQPPPARAVAPVLEAATAVFVGDEAISTYALKQRMTWLAVSRPSPPAQAEIPALQREALNSLIDERIQSQELRRQEQNRKLKPGSLFVEEEMVEEALTNMAGQNGMSVSQFGNLLQSRGIDMKSLRDQLRVALSWSRWIRMYYGPKVVVSDEKVSNMLREIAAASAKPSYLISEIFIDAGRAGGVENAINAANQIIGLLRQNANFQTLAQQYSSLPTARNGGDAGWMTTAEMEPEIVQAIQNLRPGELAQPIQTRDGAYVVLLRDRRSGSTSSVVRLKQAAVTLPQDAPASALQEAQAQLVAVKSRIQGGCAGLEAATRNAKDVQVVDLGETEVSDLTPAFREAVDKLQVNQVSDPVRTGAGLHLIAVCDRAANGAGIPSREDVEVNLKMRELAMIERRELRNLRQAATISQPR